MVTPCTFTEQVCFLEDKSKARLSGPSFGMRMGMLVCPLLLDFTAQDVPK